MKRLGRTIGTLSAVAAALLVTLVIPVIAAPAQGAPLTTTGSGSATQQWAYGEEKWVNVSITTTNATYTAAAFFGWHVIFTATNTSSTTIELEAQRALLATFTATFCSPNCTKPSVKGTLDIKAWEKDAGFVNLTTTAVVYENGTPAPAIGLLNASAQSKANMTEALKITSNSVLGTHNASGTFDAQTQSNAVIGFTPALGLVPWNLSTGLSWNSTSAFVASGAWSLGYSWTRTTFAGVTTSGSGNPHSSVNATGTVALYGHDLGTITLNNGQTVPEITIVVVGPFDDFDGVILVPHGGDMFGASVLGTVHATYGGEWIATSKLDMFVDALHHSVRFEAAATTNGPLDTSLATMGSASGSMGPLATPVGPSASEFQAQPESVPAAQHASSCYFGGCPAGSASGGFSYGLILVVGLVVAAVIGSIAVIARRTWRGPPIPKPRDSADGATPPAGAYGPPTAPTPGSIEPPRPPRNW
jgi:hypothetical protein